MDYTKKLTVSAEEIAVVLGLDKTTVYRNPELRAISKRVGRKVFWLVSDFERWLFGQPIQGMEPDANESIPTGELPLRPNIRGSPGDSGLGSEGRMVK